MLGNDHELSDDIWAAVRQQIRNEATISYNTNWSPNRDHFKNWIHQEKNDVFWAVRAEV
jgi:hypothetical protein